jgi:hypothetical protein
MVLWRKTYTTLIKNNNMTITIKQIGKTYEVSNDNTVKITHTHDAIVSVCGEYFKNKYTGEWLSELEVQDYYDAQKLDEEYENKYY